LELVGQRHPQWLIPLLGGDLQHIARGLMTFSSGTTAQDSNNVRLVPLLSGGGGRPAHDGHSEENGRDLLQHVNPQSAFKES
jgi:hypothetical protein